MPFSKENPSFDDFLENNMKQGWLMVSLQELIQRAKRGFSDLDQTFPLAKEHSKV
jgi:hypothetical protein